MASLLSAINGLMPHVTLGGHTLYQAPAEDSSFAFQFGIHGFVQQLIHI